MQSLRLLALVSVFAFVGSIVRAAPSPGTLNVRCPCSALTGISGTDLLAGTRHVRCDELRFPVVLRNMRQRSE